MMQKRVIIIASAVTLVIIAAIITASVSNQPKPNSDITQTTAPQQSNEQTNQQPKPDETHMHGSDEAAEPFTSAQLQSLTSNASNAVTEYVSQPLGEVKQARLNRLTQYLAPSSPFNDGRMAFEAEYTTSGIQILETSWTNASDDSRVAAVIYIRLTVNTQFEAYDQHQTWIAELQQQPNGSWLTYSMRQAKNLPYVESGV